MQALDVDPISIPLDHYLSKLTLLGQGPPLGIEKALLVSQYLLSNWIASLYALRYLVNVLLIRNTPNDFI